MDPEIRPVTMSAAEGQLLLTRQLWLAVIDKLPERVKSPGGLGNGQRATYTTAIQSQRGDLRSELIYDTQPR